VYTPREDHIDGGLSGILRGGWDQQKHAGQKDRCRVTADEVALFDVEILANHHYQQIDQLAVPFHPRLAVGADASLPFLIQPLHGLQLLKCLHNVHLQLTLPTIVRETTQGHLVVHHDGQTTADELDDGLVVGDEHGIMATAASLTGSSEQGASEAEGVGCDVAD
jgi:hypothetical protein